MLDILGYTPPQPFTKSVPDTEVPVVPDPYLTPERVVVAAAHHYQLTSECLLYGTVEYPIS